MENNFEKQESGLGIKLNIKKHLTLFRLVSAIAIISVAILAWQFLWLPYKNGIYQRGMEAGKQEINNLIIQNLNQFGGIKINLPDAEGKMREIFLTPKQ